MRKIAQNYKRIFPTLFDTNYSTKNYHFLHTNTQRTEASYKAFVQGLFGKINSEKIQKPILPEKEFLLKVYN